MSTFIEVALNLPVDKTFDYAVPEQYAASIQRGQRVVVPFGVRTLIGIVTAVKDSSPYTAVKQVRELIDETPVIDDGLLDLARWISGYYLCGIGEAVLAMLPSLAKQGRHHATVRKKLVETAYHPSTPLTLTQEQERVYASVTASLNAREHAVYLLHGITGSGKTEIYLQSIAVALERGRSAIVLVPEISLTPQTIERFKGRFGERVFVMHSHLLQTQRFLEWKKIQAQEACVVIGARSAVFSPVRNLGLVVIDEEQEATYKQEDTPRYHAREVAIQRAKALGATIILGSATPSLEAYYRARTGTYRLLELTHRIDHRPLPRVTIVDMRQEFHKQKRPPVLSWQLIDNLRQIIARQEQAILFLNRRGFATYISCQSCGTPLKCSRCAVTMVYHSQENQLFCHWCNRRIERPQICPVCRSGYLKLLGKGTEKVESELSRLFPGVPVERMDTDSTRRAGSHDRMLDDFKHQRTRILVGTQMVAKGHDFPLVTLVGVISTDVSLNIADFRSSERTFSLLTQVAGRAGRGDDPGEVIIQTYTPEHYSVQASREHDYTGFYAKEIVFREELAFPPFSHFIRITARAAKEERGRDALIRLKEALPTHLNVPFSTEGPAPAVQYRMRGLYRWNMIIKVADITAAVSALKRLHETAAQYRAHLTFDVDPMSV